MTSKERLLAAWAGQAADHIPLTTSCFGFPAPDALRWRRDGHEIRYWYSQRLEHIHTLDQPWSLEDDFLRVQAWLSLGVDDLLDISIPWRIDPRVTWQDTIQPPGADRLHPVLVRDYQTPVGALRHAVQKTDEARGEGWVVQPDRVPLFEDYNLPRAVRHVIARPEDIPLAACLYQAPGPDEVQWFEKRMQQVQPFAETAGVPVQAWSAFGMDAAVWMTGGVGAVLLANDHPAEFGLLMDFIAEADYGRTELAASHPGVDLVVQRGWYSSTDLWSPRLFDRFVFPHLKELVDLAHRHSKKFGYVMTTGVARLGPRLADAGVDVLYFLDPLQDKIDLDQARDLLGGRITLVGGINALTLATRDRACIRAAVERAMEVLSPTHRFILHPVDALFPDTPWEGMEMLVDAWREAQR